MKENVLYMYLPVNVYSIDHFSQEELWGTLPSAFNDPFDSLVWIDKEKIELFCDQIYDEKLKGSKTDKNKFKRETLKTVEEIFAEARDNFIVSCFTTKNDSEIMWAHYGKNGTGFVLEYSVDEIEKCVAEYYKGHGFDLLMDVINKVEYVDEYVDATEFAIDTVDYSINKLIALHNRINYDKTEYDTKKLAQKMLIYKNTCWSYEEEHRVFVVNFSKGPSQPTNLHFKIGHCKPQAIYLGTKITTPNEQILLRIAKEKEIPAYKMQAKIVGKEYKLVKEIK